MSWFGLFVHKVRARILFLSFNQEGKEHFYGLLIMFYDEIVLIGIDFDWLQDDS